MVLADAYNVIKDEKKIEGHSKGSKIASFGQSARCPVVKQPNLAALYSEVVGGDTVKQNSAF